MKYLLPALLLFAPLTGCDPSDDFYDDEGQTLAQIVTGASDLTTLEAAVLAADLDDDLAGGEFTVFAPTDTAFDTLLSQLDLTSEELLDREDLADLLGLHIVSGGTFEADDLEDGATFTALSGGTLTIVRDGDAIGIDFDGDSTADATVTTADLDATNGVLHKIDTVLFTVPDVEPLPSVTDLVVADAELTILEQALLAAELDDDFDADGTFTVFAPTDAAFEQLLADLDVTPAELLAREDLAAILQLHVLDSVVLSSGLADGETVTTLNGQTLTIRSLDGGGFGLDTEDAGDEPNATITTTDIEASNGVLHKIDAVLIPNDDTL